MFLKTNFSNFVKSFLATRFGTDVVLETTYFGKKKFKAAHGFEVLRTIHYGFEETSLGAFLFLLKEDDVVWDIGASVGLYSVYSAGLVKEVISFEPDPLIYSRLNDNVQLNNIANLTACQIGIGNKDTEMNLNTNGVAGYSPSLINLGRHSSSVLVKVRSVDSLIKEGVPAPTVMKIDIEGAEDLAVSGAVDLLKGSKKPRIVFVEMHPKFISSEGTGLIMKIFTECGYKILNTLNREDEYHLIAVI
jgi:FkbM family methyltransferase